MSEKLDLTPVKYINDPVYGGIPVTKLELEIIETPIFQRLIGLRQLAKVNYVFPGAEHSRFVHSLGVLYIMSLMTDHLLKRKDIDEMDAIKMRVAALVHDIGHYPLSHLGEAVYGYCKDNQIATNLLQDPPTESQNSFLLYQIACSHSKSAHHEQLGKFIITNNNILKGIFSKYNIDPEEIGNIFTGEIGSRNMVYSQLLHSSLDADRLDYLLRDSYQTGVKYGLVDLQYLIRLLMVVDIESSDGIADHSPNNKVLVCNKKGQHVIEHFLMSRYFHYSQVVFHKTNVAFEGMIKGLYVKLLQKKKFMYNSLDEIHDNVNSDKFMNFNDSALDTAFYNYYNETDCDEDFKRLYEMYRDRIRPKVVFEIKDLYEDNPSADFAALRWHLKKDPNKISEIIGSEKWGYQIIPITIEKIHGHYPISEAIQNHEEELRESIKVFNPDTTTISYLAEDKLSIISRLANYKSEFIRIYVLEERNSSYNYDEIRRKINELIKS